MSLEGAFEIGRLRQPIADIGAGEGGASFSGALQVFQLLPWLRGFWPGSYLGIKRMMDASGNGKNLVGNGTPQFSILSSSNYPPFVGFDGSSDYCFTADNAVFDITGLEGYVQTPGLTVGAWVHLNDAVAGPVFAKWDAASNRSYRLYRTTTALRFDISGDGTAEKSISVAAPQDEWLFVVGRFVPSTSVTIILADVATSNLTSIPASIFNSSAQVHLAHQVSPAEFLNFKVSLLFLCAGALPDNLIDNLYQASRSLFGV